MRENTAVNALKEYGINIAILTTDEQGWFTKQGQFSARMNKGFSWRTTKDGKRRNHG